MSDHPLQALKTVREVVNFGAELGIEVYDVYPRYKIESTLGKGGYGCVVAAVDTQTGETVAIKKLPEIFRHVSLTKSALREIATLRHFSHENILSVKDIIIPFPQDQEGNVIVDFKDSSFFSDVYVVSEKMDSDLADLIHSREIGKEHRQFFVYQILRGLKALHSANVVHRDLKPQNILVNASCDLKIADFGLAREAVDETKMTSNVQTLYYRAPEVLLAEVSETQYSKYGSAVDIWSTGCILAEMMQRQPLFKASNIMNQLKVVFSVVGTPSEDRIPENCIDMFRKYFSEHKDPKPISDILPPHVYDDDEVDLCKKNADA